MKRHWFLKGLKFAFFAILFLTVATFVVMRLWNWLVPPVFGWHLINFWQALGLLILCKILFGGFRGGHRQHWQSRRRMMERWEHMTPEEREKFRSSWRGRCGKFGAAAGDAKAGTVQAG
jgi:hypothetical protein